MVVCPLTITMHGYEIPCHTEACKMWYKGDCVIRTGMIAFTELMVVLSAKSEVK